MKKALLTLILLLPILAIYAQDSITFKIEELSKPERIIPESKYETILERMILEREGLEFDAKRLHDLKLTVPYNILARSEAPERLVNFGLNSFFYGMFHAYAEHRPFVISPDMIWLLICQGFSNHVNNNAEELRHLFVDFENKRELIVGSKSENIDLAEIFPQFTKLISLNIKDAELVNTLAANFSTTTPIAKAAFEITAMDIMKSYFEYSVMMVCGIPEITLLGTTEDWERILAGTRALAKYDLEWWTSRLEPVLKEIVDASKGEENTEFWMNMFKHRPRKGCGTPEIVDGWIVRFFPYDKYGKRMNLDKISGLNSLGAELAAVDLKLQNPDGTVDSLELWAGFIGLEQNRETFALTPKIGWMVREKDSKTMNKIKRRIRRWREWRDPEELTLLMLGIPYVDLSIFDPPITDDKLEGVIINFSDKIAIPEKVEKIKSTKRLILNGRIDDTETEHLKNRFPETHLVINGTVINNVYSEEE